ncbi:MAG: hypothetical protein A2491_08130 [Bacteroidetes bacterium RIFOXYC12_FULL_35_7]|nr:MAG: hypothetical protein A2491_08130 [Bacteroidetes bacterium RIFOXYC12_FULL_35_7]
MNAPTDKIIKVVKACPTDALTFEYDIKEDEKQVEAKNEKIEVKLFPNGPIKIKAPVKVEDENGNIHEFENSVAICRCSKSGNMPFCDGSHMNNE